jgi:hypothetical protein
MNRAICYICGQPLVTDDAHTFHAEGCPRRADPTAACWNYSACGEDVHESCCPTCLGPNKPQQPMLPFEPARVHARKGDPYTSDQALKAIAKDTTLMNGIWVYASEVRRQFGHPAFNDTMLTAWLEWHTGRRQQRNVVARSRGLLVQAGLLREAGVQSYDGRELMHYEIHPDNPKEKQ